MQAVIATPKISIVTISYNQGQFLEKCIRSVVDQHYDNLEYIVVDPGSTDGSRILIEQYNEHLTKKVLEPDCGPADGLNKGFYYATGEIYGYLNADDKFCPGTFAYVADYFTQHPNVDVLTGAIDIIDENGRRSLRKRTSDLFNLSDYVAGICTVNQQATFFRRSAFERARGFNVDNRIAWDGELLVDMALAGCRFATVNKILGEFRVYNESITGSGRHRQKQLDDLNRIQKKVESHGYRVYDDKEKSLKTVYYKLNIKRHLSYYLVN